MFHHDHHRRTVARRCGCANAPAGAAVDHRFVYLRAMRRAIALACLVLLASCGGASPPLGVTTSERASRIGPDELPSIVRWREHLVSELLPYWMGPAAQGSPVGNFPTFRCNDGSGLRPDAPCPELSGHGWIVSELGRDYTRMKSRQAFVYGVAYHITGEEKYLLLAQAGVRWLRQHAYEPATGSVISYWEDGKPGPLIGQRTTQDLAYAQLGLAFYYYLTREPEVLEDLVRVQRYIMERYWDPALGGGQLRWVLEDGDAPGDSQRQELVASLDQLNAYLLLVTPLLEDPALAAQWKRDTLTLAKLIKERYFAPELGMFWGTLHDQAQRRLGGRHTDFGHSIKAMWMLYLAGHTLGDEALVTFARPLVAPLLARAAQPSGCWASGLRLDGSLDTGSQWWVFAELDQAAATLALREPVEQGRAPAAYARHLPASYQCWLTRFVDKTGGDTWPWIPASWTPEIYSRGGPPKAFHWKSGYHAAEHALVAIITTAGLRGEPLPLYYAFAKTPAPDRIQPYYYRGTIRAQTPHPLPSLPNLHGLRVELTDLQ